jgi:hypothetical protein
MAADASWPLQQAVKAALAAAVSPVPVYDDVPPGAALPYVLVGDDTSANAGSKDIAGDEFTITVHCWSAARGKQQAKEIMADVYAALHRQTLTVAGFAVSMIWREFSTSLTERLDERHEARHVIHRYRIKLTEA